jgi:NitT/TauT family transport system substrate-binding protein
MRKPTNFFHRIGLLTVIFFLIGCQSPPNSPPTDQVTVQLKWVHQAQFAGFYVAQEAGYYAEENINVSFLEGGPGINILERVHAGEVDFGVSAPEQIMFEHYHGHPTRAIATTYRRNPFVLVTLSSSNIRHPKDLIGKTLAIGNIDGALQVEAMLENLNLDSSQIDVLPYQFDLAPFYEGEIDVVPAFAAGSLILMQQERQDFNLIWPGDYGIHMYSDTIVANNEILSSNPDLVTRFLRATLRGHRKAVEDAETAVSASLKYTGDVDPNVQSQMVAASQPLIHTGEDQIGWMRPEIWTEMHALLLEQVFLPEPINVEDLYTLTFLEAVYGKTP